MNKDTFLSYTCPKCNKYLQGVTNQDIDEHRGAHETDKVLEEIGKHPPAPDLESERTIKGDD